jgi:hypothetical protein
MDSPSCRFVSYLVTSLETALEAVAAGEGSAQLADIQKKCADLIREVVGRLEAAEQSAQNEAALIQELTGRLGAAQQSARTDTDLSLELKCRLESAEQNKRSQTEMENRLIGALVELKWESKLAELRRNDATVTLFCEGTDNVTVDNAQFHALGSALLFNTTVTELRLMVSFRVTETPIRSDNWEPLLHYIETSVALQIVSLDETSYDRIGTIVIPSA